VRYQDGIGILRSVFFDSLCMDFVVPFEACRGGLHDRSKESTTDASCQLWQYMTSTLEPQDHLSLDDRRMSR
jgi:hypothetical protein